VKGSVVYLILFLTFSWASLLSQSNKNIIAHSHNDYEQEHPLRTALELGYQSIEIDILLYEGQLKVSHNSFNLRQKPTIESLYLDPLFKLHETDISLRWILIDFKNYSIETLETLHSTILKYKDIFQSRISNEDNSALKIILSGNIPRNEIANNPKYKYFFLDGRIADLDNPDPLIYTPMISFNITTFTAWRRNHCLKENEITAINDILNEIHKRKIKLRFWNTEDNETIWNQLLELGVDVISVDDLEKFMEYYKVRNAGTDK